jgi:hypothetical protein
MGLVCLGLGGSAALGLWWHGNGASLGSQGSVTLTGDGRFLLVTNAGSNEVSSFAVHGAHVTLRSKVSSGGMMPTSICIQMLHLGGRVTQSPVWLLHRSQFTEWVVVVGGLIPTVQCHRRAGVKTIEPSVTEAELGFLLALCIG